MSGSPLALLIPLAVAFALAAAARFGLGAERGLRLMGIAVPLAFLLAWGVIVRPGWFASDAIGRVGHIVLGGLLLGAVLDWVAPAGLLMMAAGGIYLVVATWTEVNGHFWTGHLPSAAILLAFTACSALAVLVLWRVDVLRRVEQTFLAPATAALIQLIMFAFALASVGMVAGDAPSATGAFLMALALAGFMLVLWIREAELPAVVVLSATGGLLALAWALAERVPHAAMGVVLTGLILFADGTARRVILPKAGISRVLYPALLVATCLLPLVLAAVVTFALMRAA